MSRIPDRDAKLEYCRYELQQRQAYLDYWNTKVRSGDYKLDTTKRGREPTEEEKLKDCMSVIDTHIEWLRIHGEVLHALLYDDQAAYERAIQRQP